MSSTTANSEYANVATTNPEIHTMLQQRPGALAFAAAGTPLHAAPTDRPVQPTTGRLRLAATNAQAAGQQASKTVPPATCQQCLTLNFFFDGTGNNLDADVGTMQHSNVARLYQSRLSDDKSKGLFSFYIPGLGTYFKDIGDPGNTTRGKGMGHRGQDRLDWAFKKFDEAVKAAEARAQNPTNKIRSINVNVFGFSRGATAARAFVRDLEGKCNAQGTGYVLKNGSYPVEVTFLGIFDTVASVGMPMSANNTPGAKSAGAMSTETAMANSRRIIEMAFGEPGADPAPGDFDGHASWADGLEIPSPKLVKSCLHMVAGHELRNSFPVDSALQGTRYPEGTAEMVYPGAHSDVGGGYQPGEGARSPHPGDMLSLIPLRVMHERARTSGVPLDDLANLKVDTITIQKSFALDDEGSTKFAALQTLFTHYIKTAGSGRPIGQELLAHGYWYLCWKFFNIRRNERSPGGRGPDAQTVAQREPGFAAERRKMQGVVDQKQAVLDQATQELQRFNENEYNSAIMAQARFGYPIPADLKQRHQVAARKVEVANDDYLSEKAKLDTYANDSNLPQAMAVYDRRLVQDAQNIVAHQKDNPSKKLRSHYQNLVKAYQSYYVNKDAFDEKIAAFFDRHVHDSLAGFDTDATLPSDPRVVYVGGDNKLKFASIDSLRSEQKAA
jgi:hypothetical protein